MASAEQLHHLGSSLAPCAAAAAAAVAAVVAAAVAVVAAVAAVVAAAAVFVAVAGAEAVAADGQVLAAVAERRLPFGRSVLLLSLAFPAFQAGGRLAEAATPADWNSCWILSSSETCEVVPCRQNQSQPFQQSQLVPVIQPQRLLSPQMT